MSLTTLHCPFRLTSTAARLAPRPSAATATVASEDIKPMLPTAETGARPKVKSQQDQKDDTSHESGDKNETTDEQDEVRKRRLERFGSSPANSE